jgi:hypothetical protein
VPTVRYVHPINGPYLTIQAAVDAATAGDTILIAPGTYTQVSLTKRVHLKGETTDPIGNPVILNSASPIRFYLPWDTTGDLWIEGLRISPISERHGLAANYANAPLLPPGVMLRINRCVLASSPGFAYWMILNYGDSTDIHFTMNNCTELASCYADWTAIVSQNVNNTIAIREHHGFARPYWRSISGYEINPATWASYNESYVTTDTPGYGANYGTWYAPQWMGDAYQVDGQIILPEGVDRSLARVRLYRRRAGIIDTNPWMITTPDPVTGIWAFNILPTDCDYFVWRAMPAGYQHRIDGPYIPVQDDG